MTRYRRYVDTPFSWALGGFIVGIALGVTSLSVWLLAAGLGAFLLYLRAHGPAEQRTEGWYFAAGPALILGWIAGFIAHGWIF